MDGMSQKSHFVCKKGQHIGQYEVVGVLNQTNSECIYMGQRLHHGASVMIEVFQPPLKDELRENFLAQVRTLMMLDHPHILRLWDMGLHNHYPFLITDYGPYLMLRQQYSQGNVQPLAKVLPHLKQLASALQYAHDHQILHGDVRPENMLLKKDNTILLRGFMIEAISKNRKLLNSQDTEEIRKVIVYTAPEQIQRKASPASDQYSLAIVIYELLCGVLPFTGSYIEVADQHMHTLPPSLQQKVSGVSVRVERVLMTALAKDPAQRFNSVQAFISALEQEHHEELRGALSRSVPSPFVAPQPAVIMPMTLQSSNAPAVMPLPLPPTQLPMPLMKDSSVAPRIENSPLAPRRRGNNTVTRRVFAIALVGLAGLGGVAGWFYLSKRLTPSVSQPSIILLGEIPPATRLPNTNVLIFRGHIAGVNSVAWSPDGNLIASASDDKFVQVWEAKTGARKIIYRGHTKEVTTVSWSPNSKLIASGSLDTSVQVWEAASGKMIVTYQMHKDAVNSVSWSKDSLLVASGSDDKTVQVWNASDGQLSFDLLGHTAGVLCVGWQPDNSSVASGSWDGTLRDWATVPHGNHFNAGDQIFSYGGHGKNQVYALAWSPSGDFIASAGADQTVQISNGTDGTPRPVFFTGHQSNQHVNPVRSVAWSPSGDFIASGDTDGNVYVWQVAGRKTVFTYQGHKGAVVKAVAWSPDGTMIASASADNTVHVWQPR